MQPCLSPTPKIVAGSSSSNNQLEGSQDKTKQQSKVCKRIASMQASCPVSHMKLLKLLFLRR